MKSFISRATLITFLLAGLFSSLIRSQPAHATLAVNGCWYYKTGMSMALTAQAAVYLNGKIYVIGGIDAGGARRADVNVYTPGTDSWSTAAPMLMPRAWLVVAAVGGKIYAIGGNNGIEKLNSVEEYDPATDTWVDVAPMPTARDDAVVGVVDGKIYVIGGWLGGTAPLDAVEVYDPATDTWSTASKMPVALAMASSAVVDDRIYVMGGLDGTSGETSHNLVYNPRRDRWSSATTMPTARARATTGVVNDRIYVIGGKNASDGWLDLVQRYNPSTDSWATMNWMPTRRGEFAAAAVGDTIYAFGGRRSWDSAVVGYVEAVDFDCQNNPPDAPSDPSPPTSWLNRPLDTVLSWSAGDPDGDSVKYDVYFGESVTPAQDTTPPLVSSGQSGTAYVPPAHLAADTRYYWRIVAIDSRGAVTSGPRWSFETGTLETIESTIYLPVIKSD
jgi:N-acetylneuraminic acid mutarotase